MKEKREKKRASVILSLSKNTSGGRNRKYNWLYIQLLIVPLVITMMSFVVLDIIEDGLRPSEYVNWVTNEENGYKQVGENSLYRVEFQYRPSTYMALQELRSDDITKKELKAVKQKYKNTEFYAVKIIPKIDQALLSQKSLDAAHPERPQLSNYLNAFIQDDIKLELEDKVQDCTVYHFENGRGILPYHTMLVGFPKPDSNKEVDRNLIIKDMYLDLGELRAGFEAKKLKQEPELILK